MRVSSSVVQSLHLCTVDSPVVHCRDVRGLHAGSREQRPKEAIEQWNYLYYVYKTKKKSKKGVEIGTIKGIWESERRKQSDPLRGDATLFERDCSHPFLYYISALYAYLGGIR